MERIELDGEIYYYLNNSFVDSTFCRVPDEIAKKLSAKFFQKYDYKNYSEEQLKKFIKELKETEQYVQAKEVCEFGLTKFQQDEEFVKFVLPILTSAYRHLHQSNLAISVAQKYTDLYKCDSSALWTSIASAYCDLGEHKQAMIFLKLAIKKQRKTRIPAPEIKEVIKRVAKELNMNTSELEKMINIKDEEDEKFS